MATWNYRIVDLSTPDNPWFELREVYYRNGRQDMMTAEGTRVGSEDGREGIIRVLEMMLRDARERDIFTPPPEWLK